MVTDYFRYGLFHPQIGRAKYDNAGSIEKCSLLYRGDKKRERLADISNLAMVEFVTHPDYSFRPSDDGVHAAQKK